MVVAAAVVVEVAVVAIVFRGKLVVADVAYFYFRIIKRP